MEFRGQTGVTVARENIVAVCQFLKAECGFDMLTDLAGVDNYGEEPRFEVDYTLYSFVDRFWFRLKVRVPEMDMTVDSVTGVWQAANWHEREAFDMFGLKFRGHPNLRRILMWDGYPHHPMRKDFPLAGIEAELPETAVNAGKVEVAPMLGGPFVAGAGERGSILREPRQRETTAGQIDALKKPSKEELV
jgi:NADH-quinone oxidoreductase subunit C